ncbi:hypothetical protein [Aquimarina algiphila]|uniref:Uncharacterized protein n=1 Tax=Aquimarina algiphila TaxID=2047982 RepID=A0A554VPC1_9FLAO|nr:hypothetical protein [Aquimarina algiphila]TSE10331.1 hypothetical protein FOF46_04670 [Aquimarina algiphila]
MNTLYNIMIPILFSGLVGILGYFLKTIHAEVKQLIKELTEYTNELRALIRGIQVQIDKGIEADIHEIKSDIKHLYRKSNTHEAALIKSAAEKPKEKQK